jgi:hypothetical protein
MKTATVLLKSTSPYSQSRCVLADKQAKESCDAYEKRTWAERLHVTENGEVFIPPMALKNCLSEAAKFLGVQIPGKGKSTYTKHIEAGVLVTDPAPLGIKKSDVPYEDVFVPADGIRGSGKRVWKRFPVIKSWKAQATFYVLDETVTEDIFLQHLSEAGRFIGIGRWRPRNNGIYGRFSVEKVDWK